MDRRVSGQTPSKKNNATDSRYHHYPATILLTLFGRPDPNNKSNRHFRSSPFRVRLFQLYLGLILVWLLIFSTSTFYQSSENHTKAAAFGAQDSSIIIQILDDLSWVSNMLRNVLILTQFFRHSDRFFRLTAHFKVGLGGQIFQIFLFQNKIQATFSGSR